MIDVHCHILPGVDDGAQDLDESLAMVEAAKLAGVTEMVATPHVRDPYFDYGAMWDAFGELDEAIEARGLGVKLLMGWEVNWDKLSELDFDTWAPRLGCEPTSASESGKRVFLLELSTGAPRTQFALYQQTVYQLQGLGYEVIIAHPERYIAVQHDISLAQDFINMGCKLQASCDYIDGGRLGREKKPALAMLKEGMYSYIASDAHNPGHYKSLSRAMAKHAKYLA